MRKRGDIEPNTFMKWPRWCEIEHPALRAFERLHTSEEMRREGGSLLSSRYLETFSEEDQREIVKVLEFLAKPGFNWDWDNARKNIYPGVEEDKRLGTFPPAAVRQQMEAEYEEVDAKQPSTQHAEWKFPFIKVAVALFLFSILLKIFIFLP